MGLYVRNHKIPWRKSFSCEGSDNGINKRSETFTGDQREQYSIVFSTVYLWEEISRNDTFQELDIAFGLRVNSISFVLLAPRADSVQWSPGIFREIDHNDV